MSTLDFDVGSLIWVKAEIDSAIGHARQHLHNYSSNPGDDTQLKFAQTHVHQVTGALEMVGLAGLTSFTQAIEGLLAQLPEQDAARSSSLDLLQTALGQVTEFIAALVDGAPNSTLHLFGSYKALHDARGSQQFSESDLFYPDLSVSLPDQVPNQAAAADVARERSRACRARYQQGLLRWLKNPTAEALQELASPLAQLSAIQSGSAQRAFWWVASGFVQAMAGHNHLLQQGKPLLSRLDQQIRRVTEGSNKVSDTLMRQMLYLIGVSPSQDSTVQLIRDTYQLGSLLSAADGQALQTLSAQQLRTLREQLEQAKDLWMRVTTGQQDRLPLFRQQLDKLASSHREASLEELTQLFSGLADVMSGHDSLNERQSMDMATALLLAENALQQYPQLSSDLSQHVAHILKRLHSPDAQDDDAPMLDDLSRRAQEKLLMAQVAHEILSNLQQVEQHLDHFFRDPAKRDALPGVDPLLHQIDGALLMMGATEGGGLLQQSRALLRQWLANEQTPPAQEMEWLAESLSALGFYVEALQNQRSDAASILAPFLQPAAPVTTEPAAAAHTPEVLDELPALSLDIPFEPEAPAEDILLAPLPDLAAEPVVAESPAPAVEVVWDEAPDAELLEIYLEEAGEILDSLDEHIATCRSDPHNRDSLTVIRRSFHTLKGSGRMVGLTQLGDVAWAVEGVMNKWLQEDRPANEPLLDFITLNRHAFAGWVAELQAEGRAAVEASEILALADAFRNWQGGPMPEVPVHEATASDTALPSLDHLPSLELDEEPEATLPAVEADAPPVVTEDSGDEPSEPSEFQIGSVTISASLFYIFTVEAKRHLQTLDQQLAAMSNGAPVASEASHAAHTLRGIGHTAGFGDIGSLADALEQFFLSQQRLGEGLGQGQLSLVAESIASLHQMVGEVEEKQAPTPADWLIAHLRAQQGEDSVPSLEAQLQTSDGFELELPVDTEASPTEEELHFELPDTAPLLAQDTAPVQDAPEQDDEAAELHFELDEAAPVLQLDDTLSLDAPALATDADDFQFDLPDTAPLLNAVEDTPTLDAPVLPDEAVEALHFELDDDGADAIQDIHTEVPGLDIPERVDVPVDSSLAQLEAELDSLELQLDSPEQDHVQVETIQLDSDLPALESVTSDLTVDATASAAEIVEQTDMTLGDELETGLLADDLLPELDAAVSPEATDAEPLVDDALDMDALSLPDAVEMAVAEPMEPTAEALPAPVAAETEQSLIAVTAALAAAARPEHIPHSEDAPSAIDDIDEQLLPIFLEEGHELLPQIGDALRQWRAAPQDKTHPQQLLRTLHTVKGSARMAGAMQMGELAHGLETRVQQAEQIGLYDTALFDALDTEFDTLSAMLDRLQRGESTTPEAPVPAAEAGAVVASAAAATSQQDGAADTEARNLRVRADLIDRLVNEAGEVSIARARIDAEVRSLRGSLLELTDNVNRLRSQLRELEIQAESQMQSRLSLLHDQDESFDPLEFDRFTRLQELTRLLAESVNDVSTVQHNLLKNVDDSEAALLAQARQTRDLQQSLMRIRTVPLATLTDRLYRIVRQTAKDLGKKANLEIKGARVELDRSVLEKMTGPFEHMLRNAIDHGLESREARQAAGKPEIGEILIQARQEGNEMILTLSDDGAGMDPQRLRQKGLEQGLIEADRSYSDSELLGLIFHPGFSTASQITQLSGRGVGMDVVKTEIEDLGGRVEVSSRLGQGTTFTLHLPLTLAVTQTVMVTVGSQRYAIPSGLVAQVQELKVDALNKAYAEQSIHWQDKDYPFWYLPRLLGDETTLPELHRYNTVVLLQSANRTVALHVDQLTRNQEVVVKNIGPQLARVIGVSGATVLGSGEILLIINPVDLATHADRLARHQASIDSSTVVVEAPLQTQPHVLVVDDSLTVRKITGRLLERQGYAVMTAKDGVDALQQIQDYKPDVMLVDIEMPRMDGFELTRNVRSNAETQGIPIIMISSRTADKHRKVAQELGVNLFLGKPYQEEELLGYIQQFLKQKEAALA
ncbi:Hpt domain-containing protein [Leeia sp.]|uniref:hybrid sensor histidine kinase/response regulator n=1 Tax=Leeia sp. TaxID=2884678 RepID=UPI0035B20DEE